MAEEEKPPEYVKLTQEELKGIADYQVGGPARMSQEPVPIGDDTVQRWLSIPEDKAVTSPMTRGELDSLFFGITQTNASVMMLANAIRFLSYSDGVAADLAFRKANELSQAADNNFRLFFRAIMQKAASNG